LGYDLDSVYKFHFTFPHSGGKLQLKFTGSGLQDLDDESWGLDNVSVRLEQQATVYENTFEPAIYGNWSPVRMEVSPTDRRFLGQYGAEQVTLTLTDLPVHEEVTLAFDLYIINTWDGNVDPDIFDVTVVGGPTLLHTTFTNNTGVNYQPQSYPNAYPVDGDDPPNNPPYTGASAVGTLGYAPPNPFAQDSIYPLRFTFAHASPVLQVTFTGIGLQVLTDEGWGLDNVVVNTDGVTVYASDFESLGPTVTLDEWSSQYTSVTPSGRTFLGEFAAQQVSLELNDLPAHSVVTLAFDFYAIQTWDGNQESNGYYPVGPDIFDLSITGGPKLLYTTFSNTESGSLPGDQQGPYLQAYPGAYPGSSYFAGTGASEIDGLGYSWDGDSVYKLAFTFPHTGSELVVNFAVSGIDGTESWGLDNVKAVVRRDAEPLLFLSSANNGKIGDVRFLDEDILAYEPVYDRWLLLFDGSDVGIRSDVDGFAFLDGKLLLSFDTNTGVPGLGTVQDSDVVQFTPVWLGERTAGSFTLFFDGAAVGLDEKTEDIDALAFNADRRMVISTLSDFKAGGLKGKDEDLFAWNGVHWSFYFDGSDVGLTNGSEDIEGLWLDTVKNDIYLSTEGKYSVQGLSGDNNDIFVCKPGPLSDNTSCSFRLFWNGDEHGFNKRLDGFFLGPLPLTYSPVNELMAGLGAADDAAETEDAEVLDPAEMDPDQDETTPDEGAAAGSIFLPLIER
jgi:hypothetical protein